jgi:TonB family protein
MIQQDRGDDIMHMRYITSRFQITVLMLLLILLSMGQVLAGESHLVWLQRMIDQHTVVVQQRVADSWVLQEVPVTKMSSVVDATVAADGSVSDVRVVNGSGDPDFDRSALVAVTRSSPFPVAADPEVMDQFRHLTFVFRVGEAEKAVVTPVEEVSTGYANYPHVNLPIYVDK